jgi:Ribonuclease G/E
MKGRVIALDMLSGRTAAALIVDGRLTDLLIDPVDEAALPGAIFRAVVDRPAKGLGGAFLRLPSGSGFVRQTSGLAPGRPVLVQVSGPAEPGKALPVTTRLVFKSRYAMLTPAAPGLNISRRIRDQATRVALHTLAAAAMAGADPELGLVLRSACEGAAPEAIAADVAEQRRLAEAVLADLSGDPELLVEGATAREVAWRDWSDPAPDEVVEGAGAFVAFGVPEQISALLAPRVDLAGGGHMMIEPTRALVAVDVNTGADSSPAAAVKANIAATRDLPRQLRLRGLGGQVVIDFAPMSKRDRAPLEQSLRAVFRNEGAETSLAGWTTLGLYELVRKRDRLPLSEVLA